MLLTLPAYPQSSPVKISYLSYQEAKPVLAAAGLSIPSALQNLNDKDAESRWNAWEKQSDADIRARLEQGDEDSIINLLLYGTSFTKQPRATDSQIERLAKEQATQPTQLYETILKLRLDDLAKALSSPAAGERLNFAKNYLMRKLNVRLASDDDRTKVKQFLLRSLVRMMNEASGLKNLVEQARANKDDIFVVRSQMFSRRGLSSDTQLKPNLAIENAIAQLKEKGLLKNVRRVAIVGPGLDFTDKDEGYDFYPPQTLQPFAVIESLLKLGLSDKTNISVDTYDLSPKVNSHIAGFAARAARRENYTIHLPLDTTRKWTPQFTQYWTNFGNEIGLTPKPATSGDLPDLYVRTVSVRSEFLSKIHAYDTNIVLQSPVLAANDRYDLIIGTNIFVYYDSFDQGLAMLNLNKMLKEAGILVSNNALIEFPFNPIHSIGYTNTAYSAAKNDGDTIVWYQKQK